MLLEKIIKMREYREKQPLILEASFYSFVKFGRSFWTTAYSYSEGRLSTSRSTMVVVSYSLELNMYVMVHLPTSLSKKINYSL